MDNVQITCEVTFKNIFMNCAVYEMLQKSACLWADAEGIEFLRNCNQYQVICFLHYPEFERIAALLVHFGRNYCGTLKIA